MFNFFIFRKKGAWKLQPPLTDQGPTRFLFPALKMVKLLLCNYCEIEYRHLWNDSVGDGTLDNGRVHLVQNVWWKYPFPCGQDVRGVHRTVIVL